MSFAFSKRNRLSLTHRIAPENSQRRRRKAQRRRSGFEALESRQLLARDFLEISNDTFPGQTVQHFNPSEAGIVDSYSNGASINPDGDVDIYSFVASVGGEITVVLRNQGGNPAGDANTAADDDLVLERLNSVGAVIGGPFAANAPGLTTSFTVTGVNASDPFWVRVRGADTDDANYQVEFINRDREDDAGGNNNTLAAATLLGTFGSIPAGNLLNYTITSPDKDYYSFIVPAASTPGDFAVSASMPSGTGAASGASGPTNLGVRIRNASGTVVASSNGTTTSVDTATVAVLSAASAQTYTIEIYSGSMGQVNRYDLSIVKNPAVTGTISGFKFNDLNADGLWDENEPGLSGITINLDLNYINDPTIDSTTTTGAGGFYNFTNVPAGTHRITETIPAATTQSLPGSAGNFEYLIDINANDQTLDHIDFGNYQLDFGDAPDPNFPTLLASNGARHIVNANGLILGAAIDAEGNGQPNATATGDDVATSDDEDGVTQTNVWTQGNSATYNVASSGYGFLNAWVDLNADGDWADAGEQVATGVAVDPGSNGLSFSVPAGAVLGTVNARFRLGTDPALGITGLALDGEVEDYQFQIFAPVTIHFQSSAFTVAETAGTAAINLVLSIPGGGTLAQSVSIDVPNAPPGTATVVTDYTITSPQTVTFPAGSTDGTVISTAVPLSVVNDLLAENDETVNFDLVNLVGGGGQVTIGTPNDLTVTIDDSADRSAVSVRFLIAASSVAEAATAFPVTVELVTTGGVTLGVPVSVDVTDIGGGSATSGSDYVAVGTQTITFAATSGNGATADAILNVLNDSIAEVDETVNLGLSGVTPFGAIGAPSTHTVTITDASDRSNVAVQFVSASSAVAEAGVGHNVGVQLVMTGGITVIGADLTVNVNDAGGGTATSGSDYSTYAGQTLTFLSGSTNGATQNATLGIIDDLLAESDETVNLGLSGVTGPGVLGTPTAHQVTITDASDRSAVSVHFMTGSSSVAEAATAFLVKVELVATGGITLAVPVSVDVTDVGGGSAVSGLDYSAVGTQTVTFPATSGNGATADATLNVLDDSIAELDETVNLGLSVITPFGTIVAPSTHTVTITDATDRSAVSVRFLIAASSVAEAATAFPVTVELVTTGGVTLGVPVSVDVTDIGGGSATSGSDYAAVGTQTITFPATSGNGVTADATLSVLNDTIAEVDETVRLGLSGVTPLGAIVAPSTHTVTITDASDRSNVAVQFVAASSSVAEAGVGHTVGVQLVMTGGITAIGADLTVNVNDAGGGTATSGSDYSTYAGQTLTFLSGSTNGAVQNATLGIIDDLLAESDETVNLGLSGVTGSGVLGAPTAHQVTITDGSDRGNVSVRFLSAASNAPEAIPTHNIIVELVAAGGITLAAPVTVNVTDAATGTATGGGTDYTYSPNPKSATFLSGASNGAVQSVPVTIVDDAVFESPNETIKFDVTFVSGPAAGVSASTTHTVTIVDDDPPTVSIVQTNDGNEAGPVNGSFTISISVQSSSATTVNYSVGGTATGGSDYTTLTGTISIPANSSSVPLPVVVTNDLRVEGTETVTVTLTSVSAGVSISGSANNALVNILDNDSATVSFSTGTYSVSESTTPANLLVTLALSTDGSGGAPDIEYPISVGVKDLLTGTATAGGVDYTYSPNPKTVTFAAASGAGFQNVPVTIVSDSNPEPDETVNFVLQNLTGPATLAPPTSATLTILNDDFAAVQGRKYNDLDRSGTDNGGADPGLAGWIIQLYRDVNGNNAYEPNIYVGGVLVVVGADGDPLATAITGPTGTYSLGNASLATGRVFVSEVQQQGWTQSSSPAVYSFIHTVNVTDVGKDFGNSNCTDTQNVVNGTLPSYTTTSKGILTIELIGGGTGTFTVSKGGASFVSYDGAGATVTGTSASSRSSEYSPRETGRQRVDVGVIAGEQFSITITGASAGATLRIVNGVNVDTASLALQITGTACGETIFVADDANFGAISDAKRIYIGTTSGVYDAGVDLAFVGVEYDAALINAMFGSPTISRVDINALAGDDIVRIADDTVQAGAKITQQSTILGGDGNDILRAGAAKSTITAGNGNDFVVGGSADDTIYGGAGNDYLYGLDAADLISGDDGDDWIAGGNGDDPLLRGGNGNDQISGGGGKDRLLGEAGVANVAYRDAIDLQVTGFTAANTHFTPPDVVQDTLDAMIDRIWQDHYLSNGNDDAAVDTLDELFKSLLP